MPVLRQRERIRRQYPGQGPVNLNIQGDSAVMESGQTIMARQAKATAETMAGLAEEEGRALAKAHVFKLNGLGVPDMPDSSQLKMGRIATQNYDRVIEDKFAHQMTTAMRMQITDAQNANQYDFEAFLADAEGRLEQMGSDIPDEMQGAFQQVANGLMADAGASIGLRNANQERANTIQMQPEIARSERAELRQVVTGSGGQAGTNSLAAIFDRIDQTDPGILPPAQKLKDKRDAVGEYGVAMIRLKNDVDSMTPVELAQMRDRLATGTDEELKPYFTGPDGVFYSDAMMQEANTFQHLSQVANAKLAAANKVQGDMVRLDELKKGFGGTLNGNDKELLSGQLTAATEGGWSEGSWLDPADTKDRTDNLAFLKTVGSPDASLENMLNGIENNQDPAQLAAFYPLYLEMLNGPNQNGVSTSFEEHIGPKTTFIMQKARALAGHGNPGSVDFEKAVALVADLKPMKDTEFETIFANAGGKTGWGGTAQEAVDDIIDNDIFDDLTPLPEERTDAEMSLRLWLQTGSSIDKAIANVKQGFESRYAESEAYGPGGRRSPHAPPLHYPDPPIHGLGDLMDAGVGVSRKADAALFRFLGTPRRLAYSLFGSELQVGDKEFASTFDLLADEQITEMLDLSIYGDQIPDVHGEKFWRPGVDYVLRDLGGDPPKYKVWIKSGGRGGSGDFDIDLGTLDVSEDYEEMTQAKKIFVDMDREMQKRAVKYLMKQGDNESSDLAMELVNAMQSGDGEEVKRIMDLIGSGE